MTRSLPRLVLTSVLALALSAALATAAPAAPGELDTSFGDGGKVSLNPAGKEGGYSDVAIQRDGKIVLVGYAFANPGETDMAITRLNADGSPDNGFGVGGTVLVNVVSLPQRGQDVANAVAIQPDGKIVVSGTSPSGSLDLATVVRLLPSGLLDASFGAGGVDGDGIARPRIGSGNDVAVDASGKIVMAGTWTPIGKTETDSFVERLNSDGSPDETGDVVFQPDGGDGVVRLAVQPDGRVLTAGYSAGAGGNDDLVARTSGMALDTTFGMAGLRRFSFGASGSAEDLVIEPDGRIDVAGYGSTADNFILTRLTANGGLGDRTLNGKNTVDVDFGGNDAAEAIALQSSGKILLAGSADAGLAIARLQPGGTPDAAFGPGGKRTVSFPAGDAVAYGMALQSDGRIVLAGTAGTGTPTGAIVRLQGDSAASGGGPGGPGGPGGSGGTTKVPKCGGKRATIIGTSHKDKLRGTRRADVIVGLGGNDKISGLGGNDRVCGGSGNDSISGGKGNDRLSGDSGKDKVSGDSGNDQLHGGTGNDSLAGGSGNDSEAGDSGNDRLAGGSGKDKLAGGSGKDRLNGNGSRDSLNGGSGKDACAGNDKKKSC